MQPQCKELKALREQSYEPNNIVCPLNKNVHKAINCDIIGSGYCNEKIDNILESIKGAYSNTHSNNNNGQHMSKLIEDSKDIIRKHFNVNKDSYIVLFNGSGSTACINHFAHMLNLSPEWTVFITENEHNSNILPWKESQANVVVIPTEPITNKVNLQVLESYLSSCKSKYKLFACNAGSNVSGTCQDIKSIHNVTMNNRTLLFLDCAMLAPYVMIDANDCEGLAFSPHKFYGGDTTPGVLVCRKDLCFNNKPFCPGGGSVRMIYNDYTNNNINVIYSNDIETKESSGTPNIIGIIKIGLILKLKEQYYKYIHAREKYLAELLYTHLYYNVPNIRIMDIPKGLPRSQFKKVIQDRIPVISFQVIHNGVPIHYNYIVKILSDHYGIQCRGGVQCSPFFAQKYLNKSSIENIKDKLLQGKGLDSCYGFVRISLNYLMRDDEIQTVLQAITEVAANVNKYIDYYQYDCSTNTYSCKVK